MMRRTSFGNLSVNDLKDDKKWRDLYSFLRSLAKHFVYSFKVSSWYGQEEDIIEDIVQETAIRILERIRRAERGEATLIYSLEHMIWTIIRNYCIDMRRRDLHIVHTLTDEYSFGEHDVTHEQMSMIEVATENVYQEEFFVLLADEIASFPYKQRVALLTDLANLMQFDNQLTPLQKAFLAAGIKLQEYQQPLPVNYIERSRHASLLSIAYKRIARLPRVRNYISAD